MKSAHLLLLVSCILLAGCTRDVDTKVTRFHRLPARGNGQTFTLLPPDRYGSQIELDGYNARIAGHLEKYGWKRGDYRTEDYSVGYEYYVSGARQIHREVPIYGRTGGGTTTHYGTFNSSGSSGSFSGTSYTTPTYGVVGSAPITRTVYDRHLLLIAKDRRGNELFEIRCESSGKRSEISQVMPAMIDSAFDEFPGVSGKMETYSHPEVE